MLHGPFKWNPFSATFKEYYYLFLKVLPEEIWNFVNSFSEEFIERVRIALTADGKHLSKGDPHFRLNGTRNSNKKCYWWKFINMICTDVFNLKWLSESRTATRIITSSRAHACVSPIPKKIKYSIHPRQSCGRTSAHPPIQPSVRPSAPDADGLSNFLANVGACNLILHIHVVVNWKKTGNSSVDQYHMTVLQAPVFTCFCFAGYMSFFLPWQFISFEFIAGSTLSGFLFINGSFTFSLG